MIKKFNRDTRVQYTNILEDLLEFALGEYILYLTLWRAYDPYEDEFSYRKSFWVTTVTIFSIIFTMTLFTAALVVIFKLV